jgi:PAS domain S-box-containing protein
VLWQLLDALGDGLALTGEDGRIALVNRRCAEMFGYRREEMAGLPVDELVPADVRASHPGYRADYYRAPQARPMAERARLVAQRKDGATFPVEISLSPVPTATERYVLAVIRDATEARQRDDLADLARGVAVGQPQPARELLDRVVQHLFQVGLSLQAAADLPAETARERLGEAMDRLDEVIHEIRDYAFTAGEDGRWSRPGPPGRELVRTFASRRRGAGPVGCRRPCGPAWLAAADPGRYLSHEAANRGRRRPDARSPGQGPAPASRTEAGTSRPSTAA